ncbi:MAG TPA: DUF6458 family protein [Nocardioides sp.]|nr:DUF6458 family protein [Nocardioides sp.]
MGAGITLMVVGAILAFAVRRETPGVDVQTVGLILLVAGGLVVAHARRGSQRERTVTRVEDPLASEHVSTAPDLRVDPGTGHRTVREHVVDREFP